MTILELLRRVAAARGGEAATVLVLDDGNEIACRDEWQAMMVERLWRRFFDATVTPRAL